VKFIRALFNTVILHFHSDLCVRKEVDVLIGPLKFI